MSESPSDVFHRLIRAVAGGRFDDLADLPADPTDVSHPLALDGDARLRSRADLVAHFAEVARRMSGIRIEPSHNAFVMLRRLSHQEARSRSPTSPRHDRATLAYI